MLDYVCVQQDDATAQRICEVLDAIRPDDDNDLVDDSMTDVRQGRHLENTDELMAELSELEKVTVGEEGVSYTDGDTDKKSKSTKTLGTNRMTRSQVRNTT